MDDTNAAENVATEQLNDLNLGVPVGDSGEGAVAVVAVEEVEILPEIDEALLNDTSYVVISDL